MSNEFNFDHRVCESCTDKCNVMKDHIGNCALSHEFHPDPNVRMDRVTDSFGSYQALATKASTCTAYAHLEKKEANNG